MDYNLIGIIEILEGLLNEDLPSKSRIFLNLILKDLKSEVDTEKLLKIQDELEYFSNSMNINSYVRTEVMNVVAEIDSLL